jgi:hypothetical protein
MSAAEYRFQIAKFEMEVETDYVGDLTIGICEFITNFYSYFPNAQKSFAFSQGGFLWSEGTKRSYGKKLQSNKKYLFRFEIDFVKGNLNIFIDGQDYGLAVQNNNTLRKGKFYITVVTKGKSTIKLVHRKEGFMPEVIPQVHNIPATVAASKEQPMKATNIKLAPLKPATLDAKKLEELERKLQEAY